MQSLSFFFSVSLIFASILLITPACSSQSNKQYSIFVFGDSIFDPGNNNFLSDITDIEDKANYSPYGETFFKYPTGRFSDGLLIPDFMAMHVNLPLWIPYLAPGKHQFIHGANFASGSSGALVGTNTETLSLEKQLSLFKTVAGSLRKQIGDAETNKVLKNAVYLSSTGGVDYMAFKSENPNATESQQQEYINWVIGNITDVVKEIYKVGGRKFAFQNVGPLGCLPIFRQAYGLSANNCDEDMLAIATLHNNALTNISKELEAELSGFKYLIFDYFNSLLDRITHSSKYGFEEAYVACCGQGIYHGTDCGLGEYYLCSNPKEYVFFDGRHPTEHAYSQLAQLLWTGDSNVTSPLNLKQLFELDEPEIDGLFADQ